jgi:hypothetical protein
LLFLCSFYLSLENALAFSFFSPAFSLKEKADKEPFVFSHFAASPAALFQTFSAQHSLPKAFCSRA